MPIPLAEHLPTIGVYAIMWVGFGAMHSFLASPQAKNFFNLRPATYRKAYNTIAVLFLAPILYYSYPGIFSLLQNLFFSQELNIPLTQFVPAITLLALAVLLLMSAFSSLGPEGTRGFLGLQEEPKILTFQGPYKYCRHPIYTATFLAIAGAYLLSPTLPSAISSIIVSLYLIIGSTLEERRLRAEFPQYKEYAKVVGKFFPWKPLHLKTLKNSILSSPSPPPS